ncbi:hypothetical protein J7438_00435 [Thalassotalea sp. G20_0]|uniref:hypothetical protein n=1 Tax=Thalassotalea sp. G20_0 TaxID=2821093 RepID=UPI001ADADC9F|nr:hypothetical protein [Thalassotalea sp. G20_0]MBO9492564.1 hypothetical protein [Thalassotalea sp. G20_0]
MAFYQQEPDKGGGITFCQARTQCPNDLAQKPKPKPIAAHGIRSLADCALQVGKRLGRAAAGYAFNQMVSSPYIGAMMPGLKETLLFTLAVINNQLQPTQAACWSGQFR